jgi:hypothetical protein
MSRFIVSVTVSSVVALALWGCGAAAEAPAPAPEDNGTIEQEILDRIDALGLDSSTAVIEDNRIGVEGDILLFKDKLLAGEYGEAEVTAPDGLAYKGYRIGTKINSTNDGNIKLLVTSEVNGLPMLVTGVQVAALSWSSDSSIDIRGTNTGPSVTVKFVNTLPCPGSAAGTPACAEFPSGGAPGTFIYLKRGVVPGTNNCAWNNAQVATLILSHEMGHTIGMAHPLTGPFISGTHSCDEWLLYGFPAETCTSLGLAPYDTVMHPFAWGITSSCTVADPYLGEDDFLSVSTRYPGN